MTARDIILEKCELPAVPMVAMKILRLVESPNTDLKDMQEAIMADQGLAARVIRIANSAFYGLPRTIDTISDAVMVMGMATIKNLALAVSTREVYKNFGLLEKKLWEHSIGVSVGSGLIAREVRFFKPEEAVMAGLLHDVGKVVMNNNYPEKFMHLTQRVYEERVPYSHLEDDIFGFSHAEAGSIFAEKWEFPDFLCKAIGNHHDCGENVGVQDENLRKLSLIISLADALCLRLGVGYRGPMEDLDLKDEETSQALGIGQERFTELVEEFKHAYVKEKMLYQ